MIISLSLTADKAVIGSEMKKLEESIMITFNKSEISDLKIETVFKDDYQIIDPDQLELFTN